MQEFKWYKDNDIPLNNGNPPDSHPFLGGKEDDITITLAQVFKEKEAGDVPDPRKKLAERDTFFPEAKHLYTGAVPLNNRESFKKARFRSNDIAPGVSPV